MAQCSSTAIQSYHWQLSLETTDHYLVATSTSASPSHKHSGFYQHCMLRHEFIILDCTDPHHTLITPSQDPKFGASKVRKLPAAANRGVLFFLRLWVNSLSEYC